MSRFFLAKPPRVGYDRAKAQQDGSKNDAPVTIPQERLADFQIAGVAEPGATAIPQAASGGVLTLTCLPGYGWAAIVPGDYEGRPETSDANLAPDHPVSVPVSTAFANGGKVRVWSSGGMQCFIDVKEVEVPFDRGLGGAWGVAGDWWPAEAATIGVRRFQNWSHTCHPDQMAAVHAGELIFYPTFLIEQNDWSADQVAAMYAETVAGLGRGLTVIGGNEPNYANNPASPGTPLPPQVFAGRFRRMVEGVKRVDPAARICGPSILWYGQDPAAKRWFWDFVGQGVGPLMDAIGVHSYTAHNITNLAGEVEYWLCDPAGLLAELRMLRRDCDGHPDLAGKPLVDSEMGNIHAEGPAGLPPEHPLVRAEAARFFGEFLPALKTELGLLNVEAAMVFQSDEAKWNDKMLVFNPISMRNAQGMTEYARQLAVLAAS
jgi:hypothetical protein